MLDQVIELFEVITDYDLNLVKVRLLLPEILIELTLVLKDFKPDVVFVHGNSYLEKHRTFAAS